MAEPRVHLDSNVDIRSTPTPPTKPAMPPSAQRDGRMKETTGHGRCGSTIPAPASFPTSAGHLHPCALPADHQGWHRADNGTEWSPEPTAELCEFPATLLTAEQEIRAQALDRAQRYAAERDALSSTHYHDPDDVIRLADRFAAYIRDGLTEPGPATVDDADPAPTLAAAAEKPRRYIRDPIHDRLGGSSQPS